MVEREEINSNIFIAQTTFFIYRTNEDLMNDKPAFFCGSNKDDFNRYKDAIKTGEITLDKDYNK